MISSFEEQRSNAIACGTNPKPRSNDDGGDDASETRRNKRKSAPEAPREGSRKSRRLRGETAEPSTGLEGLPFSESPLSVEEEREERVRECREVRLRAANAVAACGGEAAARKNPTATYEHCLMRVTTMTEKGLVNRVKAIERAAGKHCVVKMAIFKSCLQDEGMWELAEEASNALERLKALKPIPEQ